MVRSAGQDRELPGGVFLCYASSLGHAPLDRRLYLPEEWAVDEKRREKCHVPEQVIFQEKWRIGLELLERGKDLPHGWVGADDEFGRVSAFRSELRRTNQRYVLDVPCTTRIRDLQAPRPPRKQAGKGRKRKVPFVAVREWLAKQPASAWQRVRVRAGSRVRWGWRR